MTIEKTYPYCNFRESHLSYTKPKHCTKKCNIVYDQHHDQYFCLTCGTVIIQSNTYETDYYTDPLYWEKQIQKRKEMKEKQKIIAKLKEQKIKYRITEDKSIHVIFTNEKEYDEINYLCEKTSSFIIITKFTDTGGRTDIITTKEINYGKKRK